MRELIGSISSLSNLSNRAPFYSVSGGMNEHIENGSHRLHVIITFTCRVRLKVAGASLETWFGQKFKSFQPQIGTSTLHLGDCWQTSQAARHLTSDYEMHIGILPGRPPRHGGVMFVHACNVALVEASIESLMIMLAMP